MDNLNLFPIAGQDPEQQPEDLYRDPFTQQLYLCTENDAPLPDSDHSFHISAEDSERSRGRLNGLVGNENLHRREETTEFKNCWSGDPSASLLQSMNVTYGTRLDRAFKQVSHFKRDDYRPQGTGLIAKEHRFGANMNGYHTSDVQSLRRGVIDPFRVPNRPGAVEPSRDMTQTAQTSVSHASIRPTNVDAGQLRKKRGAIDSKDMLERGAPIPQPQHLLEHVRAETHTNTQRQAKRMTAPKMSQNFNVPGASKRPSTVQARARNRTRPSRAAVYNNPSQVKMGGKRRDTTHVLRDDGKKYKTASRGQHVYERTTRAKNLQTKLKRDAAIGAVNVKERRFFKSVAVKQRRTVQTSGARGVRTTTTREPKQSNTHVTYAATDKRPAMQGSKRSTSVASRNAMMSSRVDNARNRSESVQTRLRPADMRMRSAPANTETAGLVSRATLQSSKRDREAALERKAGPHTLIRLPSARNGSFVPSSRNSEHVLDDVRPATHTAQTRIQVVDRSSGRASLSSSRRNGVGLRTPRNGRVPGNPVADRSSVRQSLNSRTAQIRTPATEIVHRQTLAAKPRVSSVQQHRELTHGMVSSQTGQHVTRSHQHMPFDE